MKTSFAKKDEAIKYFRESALELIEQIKALEAENESLKGDWFLQKASLKVSELVDENERIKTQSANRLIGLCKCGDERDELKRQLAELVTAIDERLVVAHIGVFNQGDDPKAALNKIACYEQSVGDYFGKEDLRKELAEYKADAERLDWIAGEYIKVDSFEMSSGCDDDADSGWVFSQYHMGKPREREIYRHYRDDLREAIDAAMKGD